jgi:LysM repeat protein
MVQNRILISVLLAAGLLGAVPTFSVGVPVSSLHAQDQTNLLKNPGFEGLSCDPSSPPGKCHGNYDQGRVHVNDGVIRDNVFTPQGWVTWWREGGNYGQPEVQVIPADDPRYSYDAELPRIHGGMYSLKLFNFYRNQDAGIYQVVTGLEPGSTVEFSAYGHGWSCEGDTPLGYTCGDPWNQVFQVGIEPNGVADPFSPNIIWSTEMRSPDHFNLIGPASAKVGEGGSVCIYLRSKTKWAYKYQDAYWDDASLVMTAPGTPPTNTPLPPPPTPTYGPSPTPRPTPTPHPGGAVIHVVQSGDTLFGIALMYNKDVNELRQLNAGSLGPNDMLQVGQELVISLPSETPTPTPLPEPPTAESPVAGPDSPAAQPGGGAAAGGSGASICVLAYHDRNGDTFRDETTEELLPNAEFAVADASGVIDRYTSNGISEPYCFTGLTAGTYRVIQTSPPGYAPSGPTEWPVALAEGTSFDFQFGNVRGESPEAPGEAQMPTVESGNSNEPTATGNASTVNRIFNTVAKVSGVFVLILAAGMAALFFFNRRGGF